MDAWAVVPPHAPPVTIQDGLRSPVWDSARTRVSQRRIMQDGVMLCYEAASGPHPCSSTTLNREPTTSGATPTPLDALCGEMRFPAWPRRWCANRHGSMHGGWIATAIDGLAAVHVQTALGCPSVFPGVTTNLSLQFLLPVPVVHDEGDRRGSLSQGSTGSGVVFCTRICRRGRRLYVIDAAIRSMAAVPELLTVGHVTIAIRAEAPKLAPSRL